MPSPKKKLPTGPIRIENPLIKHSETFLSSTSTEEQQIAESIFLKPDLLENGKQDSSLEDYYLNSSQDDSVKDAANDEFDFPSENRKAFTPNFKQESSLIDYSKLESSNLDSLKLDSRLNKAEDNLKTNLLTEESEQQLLIVKQESIKQEYGIQEVEYKKVAMRLSAEAVNRLRDLRTVTGLPYEVLVDVMIRNWDNLPAKIQKQYLSKAKQARIQRLIAGQDKAMTTVRKRLED